MTMTLVQLLPHVAEKRMETLGPVNYLRRKSEQLESTE